MGLGTDEFDALAHDLAQTDFDAVERDGLRAAWTADGASVEAWPLDGDREPISYTGADLVRATSDKEVGNAREPDGAD